MGNVGKEQGSLWLCLLTSYACYPTLYYIGDDNMWIFLMSLASSLAFDTFSKNWRLKSKKKTSKLHQLTWAVVGVILVSSLLSSYFYFNATLIDSEGEEIKLSEAVKHFFTSPIWMDVKVCTKTKSMFFR